MNRFRAALHVLRGRPLAYRVEVRDGALIIDKGVRLEQVKLSSLDYLRFEEGYPE